MKITEYKNDIDNCRFCWMCRHVCTQGRVTREEIHTARALALLAAGIMRGAREFDETTAEKLYQCSQCGYCREWCVSSYKAPEFIRAARADIYIDHQKLIPKPVASALEAVKKNGHPYNASEDIAIEGTDGENLLYIGSAARFLRPETGLAAASLLKKLGVGFKVLAGEPASGFYLWNLGADYLFGAQARVCAKAICESGCKRVVVVSPADYYVMTALYDGLLDGIEIAALPVFAGLDYGKYVTGTSAYSESAYYARYAKISVAPGCGGKLFWNGSKSRDTGANLMFTYPDMAKAIALSLLESAREDGVETVVVSGAEDAASLASVSAESGVKVAELIELADARL